MNTRHCPRIQPRWHHAGHGLIGQDRSALGRGNGPGPTGAQRSRKLCHCPRIQPRWPDACHGIIGPYRPSGTWRRARSNRCSAVTKATSGPSHSVPMAPRWPRAHGTVPPGSGTWQRARSKRCSAVTKAASLPLHSAPMAPRWPPVQGTNRPALGRGNGPDSTGPQGNEGSVLSFSDGTTLTGSGDGTVYVETQVAQRSRRHHPYPLIQPRWLHVGYGLGGRYRPALGPPLREFCHHPELLTATGELTNLRVCGTP